MALTITIEGKGVIANSDALVNDTGGTGTGDWLEDGLGSMSLSTETYLYGSSCVATAYSNKAGWSYFDIGSGNELDFTTTTGTEEGQLVYMWVFFPTPGLGESVTNGGFQLRIGSDTSNYRSWIVSASDDLNGWYGDWKCFVIDPNTTGSVTDTGTYNVASCRLFGFYLDATATAKGDNLFIDQIAVGKGLRITGTSTTGWKDVVDYCTDYPNRAWGMMQERDGIYYAYGNIYIGDSTQAANTSFSDSGRIIRFATTQYRTSGGTWATTIPAGWAGIYFEDATATYTTTFTDGVIVGSDAGRSGSTIIGDPELNVSIDFSGLTLAGSDINCYGTAFKNLTGTLAMENDTDHVFYSCTWTACAQVDPVGAAVFRNCIFTETADLDAALLWNENIDIQDCQFIANTIGAAVEHPSAAGSPYTHTKLYYSGNTYDVLNSSGSAITVTKSGTPQSDPSTYEGSLVTFQGSVDVTITVKDEAGAVIQNVQTAVYKISDRTEIMNEDTNASGIATEAYTGSTPVNVEVRCRKASAGATKYKNYSSTQEISSSGLTLTVTMIEDPNNNATT
jgi:hypothetical protein